MAKRQAKVIAFTDARYSDKERRAFKAHRAICVAGNMDDERLLDVIVALGVAEHKTIEACAEVLTRASLGRKRELRLAAKEKDHGKTTRTQ